MTLCTSSYEQSYCSSLIVVAIFRLFLCLNAKNLLIFLFQNYNNFQLISIHRPDESLKGTSIIDESLLKLTEYLHTD